MGSVGEVLPSRDSTRIVNSKFFERNSSFPRYFQTFPPFLSLFPINLVLLHSVKIESKK